MHNLAIHGYVQKFMETYCNVHVISTSYIILHFQPDSIRLLFKVLDQRLAASNGEIRWEWSSFFGICTPNLVAIQKNKPRFSGSLSPIVCGLWVLLWSCTTSHFLFSVWPSWPIWSYPQKDVHETHPSLNHVFFLWILWSSGTPTQSLRAIVAAPWYRHHSRQAAWRGYECFLAMKRHGEKQRNLKQAMRVLHVYTLDLHMSRIYKWTYIEVIGVNKEC